MATTKINSTKDIFKEDLEDKQRTLRLFYHLRDENDRLRTEKKSKDGTNADLREFIYAEAYLCSVIHELEHGIKKLKEVIDR